MAKGESEVEGSSVPSVKCKTIYMLQDDSEENERIVMQIRSRLEREAEETQDEETVAADRSTIVTDPELSSMTDLTHSNLDLAELERYQNKDEGLQTLRAAVKKRKAFQWSAHVEIKKKYGKLQWHCKMLRIKSNVLCCQTPRGTLPILPTTLLQPLLKRFHEDGGTHGLRKIHSCSEGVLFPSQSLEDSRETFS
jgi:hypothetical protein